MAVTPVGRLVRAVHNCLPQRRRAAAHTAPGAGATTPIRYDIEADWQLLNTCNYRCDYCFFPPAMLGEKLRAAATPEMWEKAFDATGLSWLLHLTGGEPSLYPGFAELCTRLSRRHVLSMNSNLTQPSIPAFAAQVDPGRVMFINAGLHPAERAGRHGLGVFLRNASILLDRGFPLFASVVATPAILADPEAAIALLKPIGLVPIPKLLQGHHGGRTFPDEYTEAERRSFRAFARLAHDANAPRMATWPEPPTIALADDALLLDGLPDFTGRSCEAGRRFVRLQGDGEVFRCSVSQRLGNLLDGSLALRPGPQPCDNSYCFYFCRKYAAAARLPELASA